MKPGYQIHVSSYENDGDNCKTEVISGLSREQAELHIYIAQGFGSTGGCGPQDYPVVGNDENSYVGFLKHWQNARELFACADDYFDPNDLPSEADVALLDEFSRLRYNASSKNDTKYDAVRGYTNKAVKFVDFFTSFVHSMLGSPMEEGYWDIHGFHRVEDGIKVYYVPGNIEDVTNQFIF